MAEPSVDVDVIMVLSPGVTQENTVSLPSLQGTFRLNPEVIGNTERLFAFQVINSVLARSAQSVSAQDFEIAVASKLGQRLATLPAEAFQGLLDLPPSANHDAEQLRRGAIKIRDHIEPLVKGIADKVKSGGSDELGAEEILETNEKLLRQIKDLVQDRQALTAIMYLSQVTLECIRGSYSTVQGRIRSGMLSHLVDGHGRFEVSVPPSPVAVSRGKQSVYLPPRSSLVREAISSVLTDFGATADEASQFSRHWDSAYALRKTVAPRGEILANGKAADFTQRKIEFAQAMQPAEPPPTII